MKTNRFLKYVIYLLILSFAAASVPGIARNAYAGSYDGIRTEYIITSAADGLSFSAVNYDNDRLNITAQLDAQKMTGKYDAVTLMAQGAGGEMYAILEQQVSEDGTAEFSFAADAEESITSYTIKLNNPNTGILTADVNIYNGLGGILSSFESRVRTLKELALQCSEAGISTDYETVYLSCVERAIEIMGEEDIYEDYIEYAVPICNKLLNDVKSNLEGYINGTLTSYEVPHIKPDSIEISGKSFMGTVSDGGIEYRQPVFLNGYISGWEDRDESDYLSKIGVNVIPYTIPINRIIGKPNTTYKWKYIGTAADNGDVFVKGNDTSLKIINSRTVSGCIYQMVPLNNNEEYIIKVKAKGDSSSQVYIDIYTSGNYAARWRIASSSDWKEYEYTYMPASDSSSEFRISCAGRVEGLYIDYISLTDANGKELLTNGDFNEWFDSGSISDSGLFGVNQYANGSARDELEAYREKGYAAMLTGGFPSMPSYVLDMEGVKDSSASYGTYVPYNPTNPYILDAVKTYLNAVLPTAEAVGNTVCFMIHNEPTFNSYGKSFYSDKWREYLEGIYSDISELNDMYGGTDYTDFASVPMQDSASLTAAKKLTKQYYDWRVFNDGILSEYHNAIAEYAKETGAGIPVGTKIMQETSPTAALVQHYGTDYENFGTNMDLNVNDGWARPDTAGQPIQTEMMWYDYQMSVNEAPVYNAENHFALDKDTLNYSDYFADWLTAMMWQGSIHGLSGNNIWLWGRSDEIYPDFINTTVQYRPDVMAQIGKTVLDINRLAEEITYFRNESAKAAILFSETTKSYNRQYENALYRSYLGAMYSSVKTDFITESKIDKLNNYSMLIIPEVTHISDAVLNAVYEFTQNGGKALMLAQDCFSYDSDGKLRDNLEQVNAVKAAATVENRSNSRNLTGSRYATVTDIESKVKNFYSANNAVNIELKNTQEQDVTDIEISSVEADGRTLINLCNYSDSAMEVYIDYNGNRISGMTNLINGDEYDGSVTLAPDVPVLLSADTDALYSVNKPVFGTMDFCSNEFSEDGTGGNVVESNIKYLTEGNIFARTDINNNSESTDEVMLVLALKNNGRLKKISISEFLPKVGESSNMVVINTDDLAENDYLECFVWDGSIFKPLVRKVYLKQLTE